jgi:hypothetical protein
MTISTILLTIVLSNWFTATDNYYESCRQTYRVIRYTDGIFRLVGEDLCRNPIEKPIYKEDVREWKN